MFNILENKSKPTSLPTWVSELRTSSSVLTEGSSRTCPGQKGSAWSSSTTASTEVGARPLPDGKSAALSVGPPPLLGLDILTAWLGQDQVRSEPSVLIAWPWAESGWSRGTGGPGTQAGGARSSSSALRDEGPNQLWVQQQLLEGLVHMEVMDVGRPCVGLGGQSPRALGNWQLRRVGRQGGCEEVLVQEGLGVTRRNSI